MTYCLMGNGLTIMADEEYLTISSTLQPSHSLSSTLAKDSLATNLTALHSQTSSAASSVTSQTPSACSHVPATAVSPFGLSSDTPTTCSLAHPPPPLTTQPPKAKHHPIQHGLPPSHSKVFSKNGRPAGPPPQPPPLTPITAQVFSSMPACSLTLPLTLTPAALTPPAQSHAPPKEEPEKRAREYRDEEEEEDEDEEEARRKASLGGFGLLFLFKLYIFQLAGKTS